MVSFLSKMPHFSKFSARNKNKTKSRNLNLDKLAAIKNGKMITNQIMQYPRYHKSQRIMRTDVIFCKWIRINWRRRKNSFDQLQDWKSRTHAASTRDLIFTTEPSIIFIQFQLLHKIQQNNSSNKLICNFACSLSKRKMVIDFRISI